MIKQSLRPRRKIEGRESGRPRTYVEALMSGTRREKQSNYAKKRVNYCKLYERYLADSGSEEEVESVVDNDDDDDDEELSIEMCEFTVGMNLNILLEQTAQNLIRSVCLECEAENWCFGDSELLRFVDALKCNTSILSLQIRYLDVSDESLVPLCNTLSTHSSIRALDLSGTKAAMLTSKALRKLVCSNSNIIFVRLEDTFIDLMDLSVINKAVRYNAMVCADPSNNPFQLSLLRKLSSLEEKTHTFDEELKAKPWLQSTEKNEEKANQKAVLPNSNTESSGKQRKDDKGKIFLSSSSRAMSIDAEICVPYMYGCCSYGSRCSYFHPERKQLLEHTIASEKPEHNLQANDSIMFSPAQSVISVPALRSRLQSRLRPARFHMRKVNVLTKKDQELPENNQAASFDSNECSNGTITLQTLSPSPPETKTLSDNNLAHNKHHYN